jgi:hypothetical protein
MNEAVRPSVAEALRFDCKSYTVVDDDGFDDKKEDRLRMDSLSGGFISIKPLR